MNRINAIATAAFALLGFAGAAQAHQIWIEQPAGEKTAVVRFGEFGENLREVSPGLLDKFGKPTATLVSAKGEQSVDAQKTASGFALPFGAAAGESIVAEDAGYPLFNRKQGDKQTVGDLPWQGTYVAEVSVSDAVAGERPGANGPEKFDSVSYVTTLTYVKADGIAALPAGPAAAPNK